jgi:hypothetical protein
MIQLNVGTEIVNSLIIQICYILKLIMEWIPLERRKRGRPRKTWMEGLQAAMTTGNLETDR